MPQGYAPRVCPKGMPQGYAPRVCPTGIIFRPPIKSLEAEGTDGYL
jgi:hypothetical protein